MPRTTLAKPKWSVKQSYCLASMTAGLFGEGKPMGFRQTKLLNPPRAINCQPARSLDCARCCQDRTRSGVGTRTRNAGAVAMQPRAGRSKTKCKVPDSEALAVQPPIVQI